MRKILLIEDELLIQKSLKKLIEKRGHIVDVESSGKDAIAKIMANDYDRVICDLMLQDTSGFDVIEESKKKLSHEDIAARFVIITAYCSEQVLNKAAVYGCQVLSKPFNDMKGALDIFTNFSSDRPYDSHQ